MPRVHDPVGPKAGPGSSFVGTAIKGRTRRRRHRQGQGQHQTTPPGAMAKKPPMIGENMLDWDDDIESGSFTTTTPQRQSRGVGPSSTPRHGSSLTKNSTGKARIMVRPGMGGSSQKGKKAVSLQRSSPTHRKTGGGTNTLHAKDAAKSGGRTTKDRASRTFQTPPMSATTQSTKATTPSVIPSVIPSPLPKCAHIRHALLVDTRILDTEEGRKVGAAFLQDVRSCLTRLSKRGATPYWLVSSCSDTTKTHRKTGRIVVRAERGNQQSNGSIAGVEVRPPLNSGNSNKKAVHVPTKLLANASWNLFGQLGECDL